MTQQEGIPADRTSYGRRFRMTESTISLVDVNSLLSLFGSRDQHIKRIRAALGVEITHRDGKIRVAGSDQDVAKATQALEQLKSLVERRGSTGFVAVELG